MNRTKLQFESIQIGEDRSLDEASNFLVDLDPVGQTQTQLSLTSNLIMNLTRSA